MISCLLRVLLSLSWSNLDKTILQRFLYLYKCSYLYFGQSYWCDRAKGRLRDVSRHLILNSNDVVWHSYGGISRHTHDDDIVSTLGTSFDVDDLPYCLSSVLDVLTQTSSLKSLES